MRDRNGFFLDCPAPVRDALIQRLGFYKLRARVTITRDDDHVVISLPDGVDARGLVFVDPRHPGLGRRAIVAADVVPDQARSNAEFAELRLSLGVPEALADYDYGDVFPADVNMDSLNGVDFKKGCFVGQEVVARMKHRGTARWRTLVASGVLPEKKTPLLAGDKPVGTMLSSDGALGLALVRIDRVAETKAAGLPVTGDGRTIALDLPTYAGFTWPVTAGD